MLKLLIEKDKTKFSENIINYIESKLPQNCIKKSENQKYTILYISIPDNIKTHRRKKTARLIHSTVNALVYYIVTFQTNLFIKDTVTSVHFISCNDVDSNKICNIVREDLIKKVLPLHYKKHKSWYHVLYQRVLQNMLENGIFAVNAFIRFRIHDYKHFVQEYTLTTIERYNRENKYIEFIESLQYFVDSRISKLKEIIVNVNECEYVLTDCNGTPIDISLYERLCEPETDKEDLLMGILLAIAPKKIILHADEGFFDSDFFSSLTNIFGNRLQVCYSF